MMKRHAGLLLALLCALVQYAHAEDKPLLHLARTLPLAGVEGRIDHLAVDLKNNLLFVAALENNTLEVLNLDSGNRARTVKGLPEPQGIRFVQESGQLFLANGGDGACHIYQVTPWQEKGNVQLGEDADNVRYDAKTRRIYVGYGDGAIGVIDAEKHTKLGSIPLKGHPESFQLEASGPRIFVNVPHAKQIAVIDRKRQAVTATWPVDEAHDNYPMALDEPHHRLFVGCRKPAKLLVLDTESGKTVAALDCAGDTDDLFWDEASGRIYMACGEGFIDMFSRAEKDKYERVAHVPTAAGARTALFVPELHSLFLAVPHRGKQAAEIRVYDTGK